MNRYSTAVLVGCLMAVVLFGLAFVSEVPVAKATSKTITVPDDYSTIQAAIGNASAGDTVFVRAGNYTLSGSVIGLTIDKPISLIGENKENTILTKVPYKYEESTIGISADNVTFSGFTVKEGRKNLDVSGSSCKIIDNKIINSYTVGIDIGGNNNVVSGNDITDNPSFGIYLTSSDSLISNNNIANNNAGIIIDSCKNVTIKQNNITENGGGGGLALRWNGPFYIEQNNITDNQGFGIQFGEGTNNSIVYRNNIIANQFGFNLLNYITNPFGITVLGFGNKVYGNNIVNNNVSANVEHTCFFTANVSEGEGNGTDVVSWNNGVVGNYWSDYSGQGTYVVDQNNTDHYPLMQQVDISLTAPIPTPSPTPSPSSSLSPSPSIPEFPSFIVIPIVISTILAATIICKRKLKHTNKPEGLL